MASARSISSAGRVSKYAVQSIQVKAFSAPPRREISLVISPLPKRLPPLNSMCSTQCETPVVPGSSLRPPTRYHIHTPTRGRSRTSRRMTRRPLSSVVCWKDADADTERAIGANRNAYGHCYMGLRAAGADGPAVGDVLILRRRQAILVFERHAQGERRGVFGVRGRHRELLDPPGGDHHQLAAAGVHFARLDPVPAAEHAQPTTRTQQIRL